VLLSQYKFRLVSRKHGILGIYSLLHPGEYILTFPSPLSEISTEKKIQEKREKKGKDKRK